MPHVSAIARSKHRTRLLTVIRNAAINVAMTVSPQGGLIIVDPAAFKRLTRAINRLMDFEDEESA
ncbi:MAG: hypothetical protein QOK37_265 [Thermoanaerobaculia bacterium]|nr:hypothetical protein [Thermoanaerobaculia bacterium]